MLMSQPEHVISRRRFLQWVAIGSSVAAILPHVAQAEELPPLGAGDPTASALAYTEDAASVDAARFPQHKAGDICQGCNFYQGKAARGACSLFPGKSVAGKGWCSAFVAKA